MLKRAAFVILFIGSPAAFAGETSLGEITVRPPPGGGAIYQAGSVEAPHRETQPSFQPSSRRNQPRSGG